VLDKFYSVAELGRINLLSHSPKSLTMPTNIRVFSSSKVYSSLYHHKSVCSNI